MTGVGCLGVGHSVGRYGRGCAEGIPSAGVWGCPPAIFIPPLLEERGAGGEVNRRWVLIEKFMCNSRAGGNPVNDQLSLHAQRGNLSAAIPRGAGYIVPGALGVSPSFKNPPRLGDIGG